MSREYPAYPIPAIGVVVVKEDKVLLVQRGREPARGRWTIPGGVIEVGETIDEAARRELREECAIEIAPGRLLQAFEWITRDADGRPRFHYLILDVLGTYVSGDVQSGDDVMGARWFDLADLQAFDVMDSAAALVRRVLGGEQ